MITPVKSLSLQFTSDGTSTALQFDLSAAPLSIDFTGQQPVGIQSPVVTTAAGPVAITPPVTLNGTIATVTFPTAPPQDDLNGNLIVYTLTFLLQFAE